MSGLVKGVKKVFKKVGKIVKKIAPFALPIAAAVFTVGGFLGIPAMAGGWSGAVGKLFGGSTLGKVLGGAVTQAGYMGLAGGAIGGIAGGKEGMLKGSLYGQAAGAVIGGVGGAMSAGAGSGASTASQSTMGPGGAAPGTGTQGISPSTSAMRGYGADFPGQYSGTGGFASAAAPQVAGAAQTGSAMGITQAAQQLPSAGMVQGAGQGIGAAGSGWWANQDPIVQASMITSLGAGLPAAVGALTKDKDDDNPQLAVEEARRKAIAQNYAGFKSPAIQPLQNRPVQRYEYDPSVGRVVLKYA